MNLVNGIAPKDALGTHSTGEVTVEYLRSVLRRVQRITTTEPGSLGLHPLVYFYTRGGMFQPVAFLAVSQFVNGLVKRRQLDRFTSVRQAFEAFVMQHKEACTLIVKRQGAGPRSRPALEEFLFLALEGLWEGKDESEMITRVASDPRFSFFAMPAPIRCTPITLCARRKVAAHTREMRK